MNKALLIPLVSLSILFVACSSQPPAAAVVHDGITFDATCVTDGDCDLINRDLGYGCCYAGYCDDKNYASNAWIAVNSDSLENARATQCPAECGPAPTCEPGAIDDLFVARCNAGLCEKSKQ